MNRIESEFVIRDYAIEYNYITERKGYEPDEVIKDKVRINAMYKQQAINNFENWMFNIKKIHSYHIISVTEIEENKQVLKYTEDDV